MRSLLVALLALLPTLSFAQACIVETQAAHVKVKLCQQNRTIPEHLFRSGFCKPQLAGQKTKVTFVERCPTGAFGVCRNSQTSGVPYQQDIYYYGVETDARYLKPACERQNNGTWMAL